VDDDGAIVGIVSEADLIRRGETSTAPKKNWLARLLGGEISAAHDFVAAHSRRVSDVMTREVVTASEQTTLRTLAELMERHHIKRIPIMRGRALAGVVSRADLLRSRGRSPAQSASGLLHAGPARGHAAAAADLRKS
jgi:CBS domain-containing protein